MNKRLVTLTLGALTALNSFSHTAQAQKQLKFKRMGAFLKFGNQDPTKEHGVIVSLDQPHSKEKPSNTITLKGKDYSFNYSYKKEEQVFINCDEDPGMKVRLKSMGILKSGLPVTLFGITADNKTFIFFPQRTGFKTKEIKSGEEVVLDYRNVPFGGGAIIFKNTKQGAEIILAPAVSKKVLVPNDPKQFVKVFSTLNKSSRTMENVI